jgi:hypothetical protein
VKVLTGGLASAAVVGALVAAAPAAAQAGAGGWEAAPAARSAQAARPDGLPTRWCGERNSLFATRGSGPEFKLVYAHPADRPDRFRAAADALQADAAAISRFVAWRSGWSRTVRFDMGTSCGPEYVNLAAVTLPRPRREYVGAAGPDFGAVADDVLQRLPVATDPRNVVVLADTIGDGRVLGTASPSSDDRDVAENAANYAGREAMVFSADSDLAGGLPGPMAFLHEMLHTIGAVAPGAPHGSGARHCTDAFDLMCYDDGAGLPMRWVCAPLEWVIGARIDCGGDDYFDPRPAPGSYLATHWNVYDSHFLGSCVTDLVAACGTDRSFAPGEATGAEPWRWEAPPAPRPALAAGRPMRGRQQTASPLRRVRRGRMAGFPLSTVRAQAYHDADERMPEPIVSVRSSSLRLPRGRWRVVSCVAAATTVAGITRHAPRCKGAGAFRLRRATQVRPPERTFSFARRGGMPRLAAGWVEVRGRGARERLWAGSLDRRDPDLLIRPDG